MATVNSLARNKESLLHLEGYDGLTAKLTSLAQQTKQKCQLLPSFSKCSVISFTSGLVAPVVIGEESYMLFRRKNDPSKWIFLIQVQQHAEPLHKFDPTHWSFMNFWKDGGLRKR